MTKSENLCQAHLIKSKVPEMSSKLGSENCDGILGSLTFKQLRFCTFAKASQLPSPGKCPATEHTRSRWNPRHVESSLLYLRVKSLPSKYPIERVYAFSFSNDALVGSPAEFLRGLPMQISVTASNLSALSLMLSFIQVDLILHTIHTAIRRPTISKHG